MDRHLNRNLLTNTQRDLIFFVLDLCKKINLVRLCAEDEASFCC